MKSAANRLLISVLANWAVENWPTVNGGRPPGALMFVVRHLILQIEGHWSDGNPTIRFAAPGFGRQAVSNPVDNQTLGICNRLLVNIGDGDLKLDISSAECDWLVPGY